MRCTYGLIFLGVAVMVACVTTADLQKRDAAIVEYIETADELEQEERLDNLEDALEEVAEDVVERTEETVDRVRGAVTGNGLLDLLITGAASALLGAAGGTANTNRVRDKRRKQRGEDV